MDDKRFIEESFPVKEVSEESAREKNIRHGHISTLHIWWARRPLASSRATNYAALIPAPRDETEWNKKKQFIIDLCKWESSNNRHLIEKARKDILEVHGGKPPKVLDPFAGGGAIPLEALRLGCETYAGEYNPVATLILKCTLEYPQKYGRPKETSKDWNFLKESLKSPLSVDVNKWGNWILEEAKKEIGKYYSIEKDGSVPVAYIWARTILCQNPSCHAEIPLMRQFWLVNSPQRKVALKPLINNKKIEFNIINGEKSFPKGFDPSDGTVSRAIAKCLVCGAVVDGNTTRKIFQKEKAGQRIIAVVLHNPGLQGKTYRIASEKDLNNYLVAEKRLARYEEELMERWGIEPVPNEPTPEGKGPGAERAFSIRNYGLKTWGDLFNSRQKIALITFVEKVRNAYEEMKKEGYDEEYAKAITCYLALAVGRLVSFNSALNLWVSQGGFIANIFTRQTLSMIWDHAELNPFSDATGDWNSALGWILRVIDHCSQISNLIPVKTSQSSATSLHYDDNYFDAVFTDPPYYDNVPYSYLSDFFYVWLKRTIGELYPELFSTPLSPKSKEIVAYTIDRSWEEAREYFEEGLKKSFQEISRVLKPNGIATIVYTHKSTSGWETLINSLLESGLVVTASWPIDTERKTRLRAKESAALASSVYFVTRKEERQETGWLNEVKEEIKKHLHKKLERLWEEGISGADFFVAGIGSAIEIFGKYEKVLDYEGNVIRADKLLNFVRDVVTDYAVRQILHNGIAGELSPLTKFYILWRWTYQDAKIAFDDARKLAQSSGIDLSKEWNKGFIRKEKEFIKVLGPHERNLKEMKGSKELIDALHQAVMLWKEGKREDMRKVLQESGWGDRDAFYRVADAISKTMIQKKSKENQLLDGFLSGKKQILSEVTKVKQKQLDLFISKGRE
jgi:adenine-specific DNA methylase